VVVAVQCERLGEKVCLHRLVVLNLLDTRFTLVRIKAVYCMLIVLLVYFSLVYSN